MKKDSVTENIIDELEKRVKDVVSNMPKYVIEIGVFDNLDGNLNSDVTETNNERIEYTEKINKKGNIIKKPKKVNGETIQTGVLNADIMFVMEYGSPTNNIPARPILHQTVEWAQKNLLEPTVIKGVDKYIHSGNINDFEVELEKMCQRIENYVKTGVRRRTFNIPPDSTSTIEKKGSDLPLFDTGQLVNSIHCIFRQI